MNKNKIIWLKDCGKKILEGFLQHIGVILAIVLLSAVIYLLNKINKLQIFIRKIPTDWVFGVALIIITILIIINRKQQKRINIFEKRSVQDVKDKDKRNAKMITHFGVWWKIYPDSEYIEDFPYCTCCSPSKKLIQIKWFPDEIFQCLITKIEFKLFGDEIPLKRTDAIDNLYSTYFKTLDLRINDAFWAEYRRLKELNSKISDNELFDNLFQLYPLNRIPKEELENIRNRYPKPTEAFGFIESHFTRYKKYLKK